ncbi:MAG TPA: adenylate kinase [Ktedonobacteraceae bacterium]|nr:adenylate kinase [Ktedonobacteraceae bacterium]
MNIILIGAQGSGKGTQAQRLAQALGIRHVASGDMFRKEISERSELGLKAQEYIDRGSLVPDDITVNMILSRLNEPGSAAGVLLDGFPRTVAQAQALDAELEPAGRGIDRVVYLKVPEDVLVRRLSGRYICRANQHVYNIVTKPPKVAGVCDLDGSELYQRSDDQGDAVQKRLDTFFRETTRLFDYYNAQGKLVEVNGDQDIEQVQQELINTIKEAKEQKRPS